MKRKVSTIKKGETHLIPFPFTDFGGNKLRPCVVIGCDREDIMVVFVTSMRPKNVEYIEVIPTKENRLKVHSYIRYTKIATLDMRMSLGQTGTLETKTYKALINAIGNFIG